MIQRKGAKRHGRGGDEGGGRRRLRNVVAGQTALSTIDGAKGILTYRGIDIHGLAEQSTFEEAVFLLHRGTLPTRAQLDAFRRSWPDSARCRTRRSPSCTRCRRRRTRWRRCARSSPPWALSTRTRNDDGEAARTRKALRLTAQMATVVATIERIRNGWAPVSPDLQLGHAAPTSCTC
jgi:citrate synthase